MDHTIDANTKERKASEFARYGARYYPVDPSYDKRVYENTCGNYLKIIGCLVAFWFFNALHWFGVLSLGIVSTNALGYYSVGCFFFTVFFLAGLLISGKYANKHKRYHEFLLEKIAEKRAEENEEKTKKEQAKAHEEKLRAQAERLAALAKAAEEEKAFEAAAAAGEPEVAEPVTSGMVTNIQDEPQIDAAADNRLIQMDNRA